MASFVKKLRKSSGTDSEEVWLHSWDWIWGFSIFLPVPRLVHAVLLLLWYLEGWSKPAFLPERNKQRLRVLAVWLSMSLWFIVIWGTCSEHVKVTFAPLGPGWPWKTAAVSEASLESFCCHSSIWWAGCRCQRELTWRPTCPGDPGNPE